MAAAAPLQSHRATVGASAVARTVPLALAVATVLAQIAYPLVQGANRDRLTVATVLLFFAASVAHAAVWRGWAFAAVLVAVTAGGGLAVEALGVATTIPFGAYVYSDSLGPKLFGVPAVIPLAWTMMAYPALLVGQRIAAACRWGPIAAGAALASWDLFLDPQMVDAGHWTWQGGSGPALVGIPVLNFVAWFVVATAMMAVLWPLARRAAAGGPSDDRIPLGLYLWTYGSSVLAHVVFFGLPGSALLGGVGMGAVVALLVRALRNGPRQVRSRK